MRQRGCLARELAAQRCVARAVPFEQRLVKNEVTGCLEWSGARDRDGYGTLRAGRRDHKAHRVAFEKAFGPIPAARVVCHHCDNPPCCNPEHLFLGTPAENNHDRNAKGRQARGERNANAKIADEDVRMIRKMLAEGMTQAAVGRVFGVHQTCISRIHSRTGWAHVPDDVGGNQNQKQA
jgi:hypothetical protein